MLTEIILALRSWLSRTDLPYEILTNTDDSLRVFFETDNALAELRAGDPGCAPYHFVSLTVLDTRLDPTAEPVFCFHDHENSSIPISSINWTWPRCV